MRHARQKIYICNPTIVLRIRLTRTGKIGQASFRIVVAEHSKPVKGKYIENLGYYIPVRDPKEFKFDKERIAYWIKQGAKPSDTLAALLKANGMPGMDEFITYRTDKQGKKRKGGDAAAAAAPTPAAPAPKAEKAEAPKAEAAPAPEAPKEEAPAA